MDKKALVDFLTPLKSQYSFIGDLKSGKAILQGWHDKVVSI